jgi:hypothetical protein
MTKAELKDRAARYKSRQEWSLRDPQAYCAAIMTMTDAEFAECVAHMYDSNGIQYKGDPTSRPTKIPFSLKNFDSM